MPYRNILWIKLEKRLLNDYRWYTMSEEAQLIFIKILLLAAETSNKIPKNLSILKTCFRSGITEEKLKDCLKEISTKFPKFRELSHFYSFSEWDSRHNPVNPKEFPSISQGAPKDTVDKNRIDIDIDKEKNKSITTIFSIFQKINPTINYGNKTQRQAIIDLLKVCAEDLDKLKGTCEYAISIQGQKYAPVITTPYQLKQKLGDLMVYYKKENTNSKGREILGL